MAFTLTWRGLTSLPVDGSPLSPSAFRGLSADQVRRALLLVGNRKVELAELFDVRGDGESEDEDGGAPRLTIEGDLRHVHGLARGMNGGVLAVEGDVGPELGAELAGGSIVVSGSAGDWAGAEMRGGLIHIKGNAGSFLGAAYPGSRLGMREGVVLVEGSVGDDAGILMRRGLIAVRGDAGGGLGRSMIAGTIIALGNAGPRLAAGMKRGTLVLPNLSEPPESILLPSFARAGAFSSPFLGLYERRLADWGFPILPAVSAAVLERYNGDLVVRGQGEVLVGRRGALRSGPRSGGEVQ